MILNKFNFKQCNAQTGNNGYADYPYEKKVALLMSGPADSSKIYTKQSISNLVNALPMAISVIDKQNIVVLANQKTSGFMGRHKTELVGRVGGEAFGCVNHYNARKGCGFGENCQRCVLRGAVKETLERNHPVSELETSMTFKKIGLRHLKMSTVPINLSGETVALLIIEDTTAARQHEATRIEKEKLAAVVETTGAVCHEINQPLMSLLGFAQLLMKDPPKSGKQADNLKEIKVQAERISAIVNKLTTITKYETKPYLKQKIIDIDKASAMPTKTI